MGRRAKAVEPQLFAGAGYHERSPADQASAEQGSQRHVIASFADLGSYGLLLGLQDTLSLEVFYDSVLGKLQEYDEQNSSDLVKSLGQGKGK